MMTIKELLQTLSHVDEAAKQEILSSQLAKAEEEIAVLLEKAMTFGPESDEVVELNELYCDLVYRQLYLAACQNGAVDLSTGEVIDPCEAALLDGVYDGQTDLADEIMAAVQDLDQLAALPDTELAKKFYDLAPKKPPKQVTRQIGDITITIVSEPGEKVNLGQRPTGGTEPN